VGKLAINGVINR